MLSVLYMQMHGKVSGRIYTKLVMMVISEAKIETGQRGPRELSFYV